jgi:hypothetical protein
VLSFDAGKTVQNPAFWKQKGWRLGEGDATPAGWSPVSQGGQLQMLAKGENGKPCLTVNGTVCIGTANMRPNKYWLCQVRTKGAPVKLYMNEKEPMLLTGDFDEWQESAALFSPKTGGSATCFLSASGAAQLEGLTVREFENLADAVMAGIKDFRTPPKSVIGKGNGDMELAEPFSVEERKFYVEGKKWILSDKHPVGFSAHQSYDGKTFQLVEDAAVSHSGKNCVTFTTMGGGEFGMKPDKAYVLSLYAKGSGKLWIYGAAYGGPKGGHLGNCNIADWYVSSPDWMRFTSVITSNGIKGYENKEVAILPVFQADSGIYIDDVSVYAVESQDELLKILSKVKSRLSETLGAKSPDEKIRKMLESMLKEADALEAKLKTDTDFSDGELQSRIFALDELEKKVSSAVNFN